MLSSIDFNCKFLACCNNSDQKTHTVCFGFEHCSENPYFTLVHKFLGWFPGSCIIHVEALQPQLAVWAFHTFIFLDNSSVDVEMTFSALLDVFCVRMRVLLKHCICSLTKK